MLVYSVASGFLLGVAFAFLFDVGFAASAAALVLAAVLMVVSWRTQVLAGLVVAVGCAALAGGIARAEIFIAAEQARSLEKYAEEKRVVEGVVHNDPERRETSLHVYLRVERVDGAPERGLVLAMLPREAGVHYGDRVRVKGTLEKPEAFETDTGRMFDYPSYLRSRGASALLRYATLEHQEEGAWSPQRSLYAVKHSFEHSIRALLPEPHAALMEGMLLGERRGIPEDLNNALVVVGLIHIVVLSGYNISIVAEQALRFFNLFFSRRVALLVGAGAVVIFAIMVGAGATVVRATLMGLIAILARVLMRLSLALRALAFAGAAMVLWNPPVIFDPSFILSMLATVGLITLSPAVEKRLTFVTERFGLRSILASTIAVQIYILPALLYMTGMLSFVSLFANALVLPLVPVVMLMGLVAGLVGLLHSAAALPFAVLAHALLLWVTSVATVMAELPLASAVVAAFPLWVAIAAYVPLTLLAVYSYRNAPQQPSNLNF